MSIVNISSEIGNREAGGNDAEFTIQLKKPLQKVIGMQLLNATIPLTYNIINSTDDKFTYSYADDFNDFSIEIKDKILLRHGTHSIDDLCMEIAIALREGRINEEQRKLHIDNRNISIPIGIKDLFNRSNSRPRTRDVKTTIGHGNIKLGMTVTAISGERHHITNAANGLGSTVTVTNGVPTWSHLNTGASAPGHHFGDLLWILDGPEDGNARALDVNNNLYGAKPEEWTEYKAMLTANAGVESDEWKDAGGWHIRFVDEDNDFWQHPGYDAIDLKSGDYHLAPERCISFFDDSEHRIIIAFNIQSYGTGLNGSWNSFKLTPNDHETNPNPTRILKTFGFNGSEVVADNHTADEATPREEWYNMQYTLTGSHPPQPAGPGMLFLRIGGDILLDQQNSETHNNDRIPIPVDQAHGNIVHYESDHEADIIPFSVPCDVSRIKFRIEYGDDNQVVGGPEALGGHESYFRIKFYKQHAKNGPHKL